MENLCQFKHNKLMYYLLLWSIRFISIQGELTSVINTDKGPVQGDIRKTVTNSIPYSSFKGIPYGKPPIGNLRFKPPVEADAWSDTFLATSDGNQCPQLDRNTKIYTGNESCLNLNVYTPKINFTDAKSDEILLPVVVWIFGGKFKFGGASSLTYSPDYFIDETIVFVNMNYRLGALGLLAIDHPHATGNQMLKDQQLAFKWIQKNIKKFGGNPNDVTIFGYSTSASCVDLHLISKLSQGLFHKAIAMDGGSLNSWGFSKPEEAKNRAFKLGELLGIKTEDKNELLEELYKKSPEEIVLASENVEKGDRVFKPTIENKATAAENTTFLTECPVKFFKNGKFLQLPYITGFVTNEFLFFAESPESLVHQTQFALNSMELVLQNKIGDEIKSFGERLSNSSNPNLTDFPTEFIMNGINLLSDVLTLTGIDTKQQLMAQHSSAPIFYYRNSFDAGSQSLHQFRKTNYYYGVAHADDLPYVVYMPHFYKTVNLKAQARLVRARIVKMWTNFVKYGNPTPQGFSDPLLNITWPASGKQGIHLEIGNELSIGERPINENIKILEQAQLNGVIEKINGCDCSHCSNTF